VTFGEAMLRLSPCAGVPLERAECFDVEVAGSESNVAVALARLGEQVSWVSCLPDNPLGRHALNKLREHGVDVADVALVEDARMGLFFYEPAVPPRLGRVVYDRAGSGAATMGAAAFPASVLDDATLLHLSGITPALGPNPRAATEWAVAEARRRGVPVSFDLNYRSKLASPQDACGICDDFAGQADFFFVARRDAALVLGIVGSPIEQLEALKWRYPRAVCVMTDGTSGAHAHDGAYWHVPAVCGVELDRLGRGDAFCAGFIWGYRRGGTAYGLRCGAALASLKQTYVGDLVWATPEDLLACLDVQGGLER